MKPFFIHRNSYNIQKKKNKGRAFASSQVNVPQDIYQNTFEVQNISIMNIWISVKDFFSFSFVIPQSPPSYFKM